MRHHYILLVLAVCCGFARLSAQPTFQKALQVPGPKLSNGHSVAAFGADRIYVGGYGLALPARNKAPLMAFSADGTFLWGKIYSTIVYNEDIQWIEQNPDGSLMLLMARSGAGVGKIGVVKTTAEGKVIWSKTYTKDGQVGVRMLRLVDGYVLCGSEGRNTPAEVLLAFKIDFDGNLVWEKTFKSPGIFNHFNSMAESPDGSIFLSGGYSLTGGQYEGILVKLASDGTFLWSKNYAAGGEGSGFYSLVALSDGTVVLGGQARYPSENLSIWVLHLDAQGNVITSVWMAENASEAPYLSVSDLARTPDDKVLMTLSPGIMAKISPDAVPEWAYKYAHKKTGEPYPLFLFQVRNVPDGGYLATGVYEPTGWNQKGRVAMVKTDAQGLVNGCCLASVPLVWHSLPVLAQNVSLVPQGGVSPVEGYVLATQDFIPNEAFFCDRVSPDLTFSLSDSVICPAECVTVLPTNPTPGFDFSFSTQPPSQPGSGAPGEFCFSQSGKYVVEVRATKAGCLDTTATLPLRVRSLEDQIPNAFTPNGDGLNDVFRPIYFCPVAVADFRVYDRWGRLVFQTQDPEQGWDGTFQGQPAPAEVYAWRVEYEALREDGKGRFSEKGDVTLLR